MKLSASIKYALDEDSHRTGPASRKNRWSVNKNNFKCHQSGWYISEIHKDEEPEVLYDIFIWPCGEEQRRKIYYLRKTLIIPIHKT